MSDAPGPGAPRTAVVAGASGFIGQVLVRELTEEGYRVRTIGRAGADARWGDAEGIRRLLDGLGLWIRLGRVHCPAA